MGYYEFKISAAPQLREALVEKTARMGALGSVVEDGCLRVYFSDVSGIRELVGDLNSFRPVLRDAGLTGDFTYDYIFISERDWNEPWKKKFQPVDLGAALSVIPPWERARPGRVNIIIDPGMAFGTGHHETTQRCLALIERHAARLRDADEAASATPELSGTTRSLPAGRRTRFLDIGTGTGILAIAASKLGFSEVAGLDIDPLAVDAARRNVDHNDLRNVEIQEGTLSGLTAACDFVAANLLSDTLVKLAAAIARSLCSGGTLVASGMMRGQDDEVTAAMEKEGLTRLESHVDGRWVSLVFRR